MGLPGWPVPSAGKGALLRMSRLLAVLAGVLFAGPASAPAAAAVTPGDGGLARPVGSLIAEPAGWVPVFASDFSGGELPRECQRSEGPHGGTAASYYRPDEVSVSDGMLRLSMQRRNFGGRPYTTGGIACHALAQQYGKYEFRAKAPSGAGIDAYATLSPESGAAGEATTVDLLGAPGAERVILTNSLGSEVAPAGNPAKVIHAPVATFHTYLIEWAPTGFRVSIDNRVVFADGRISTARRWLGFAVSSGDAITGLPDAATVLPAQFQVDFVRVWAYEPDAAPGGLTGALPDDGRAEVMPGGPAAPDARQSRSASMDLRQVASMHAEWISAILVALVCVGSGVVVLHRRRPRRPPSAHRA